MLCWYARSPAASPLAILLAAGANAIAVIALHACTAYDGIVLDDAGVPTDAATDDATGDAGADTASDAADDAISDATIAPSEDAMAPRACTRPDDAGVVYACPDAGGPTFHACPPGDPVTVVSCSPSP